MGRKGKISGALQRVLDEDESFSTLQPNERLVRITESRGKGLFMVEEADGKTQYLVCLQPKFRNALWMHRGTFVVIQLSSTSDTAVVGEIGKVLLKEQIKELKKLSLWPFPDQDAAWHQQAPQEDKDIEQSDKE